MGCVHSTPAKHDGGNDGGRARSDGDDAKSPKSGEAAALYNRRSDAVESAQPSSAAIKVPHADANGGQQANDQAGSKASVSGAAPNGHSSEGHTDERKEQKGRRAAAGSEAIRDQIRKLAVGIAPASLSPSQGGMPDCVSESDDEDVAGDVGTTGREPNPKPDGVAEAICEALRNNFVFGGIRDELLRKVVDCMYGIGFRAGSVVLQQGARPKPDDCMYFLQEGDADVSISGAVDQSAAITEREQHEVVGHSVRIPQKPGWVFGDVALLFQSTRSASVVARTNITVWALDRATFLRFVMKHAQGARALRFLRKLPLLKGLSDNDLIRAAARMPMRKYQDGDALIKYGERGDELFLIRYGKVRVLRPDGKGGSMEVVKLGRGQFVGERAVINNKLRSADCVAQGEVTVVVLKKRDFMDLDNPLLAWMMDYDVVSTCLRFVPALKGLKQEQQEQLLDLFDAREAAMEGATLVRQGDVVDSLCVIKLGEVKLLQDGQAVLASDTSSFLKEAAGFTFFGDAGLLEPFVSPYTVMATSETVHVLKLHKGAMDHFLGHATGLTKEEVLAAIRRVPALAAASESDLKTVAGRAEERTFAVGDVVSRSGGAAGSGGGSGGGGYFYLVKAGSVALVEPQLLLPGQLDSLLGSLVEHTRLLPGDIYSDADGVVSRSGDADSTSSALRGGASSLVAAAHGTVVVAIATDAVESILARARVVKLGIRFHDLEMHRIIGTGQFGMVRLVRGRTNDAVYALKAMHKAPIVEGKQIEHVLNERRILQQADSSFCVQMVAAYQDERCLYFLQEWVPGGELFHLLDIEGSFDEATVRFYTANVLLAFEFLHAKGIIYRDLKPENLLLDAQGYLKMADFGFAKHVGGDKTYTICGTPDYQAPEVIMRQGTTKAADYWGLGILIFELLVGDTPFKSLTGDPWDTFRQALSGRFYVPNFISDDAADIIFKLLQVNPSKRLGSGPNGAAEIKSHRFFKGIDWEALEQRKLPAPRRPRLLNPLDTSNFDNFDDCEVPAPPVPEQVAAKQPSWEDWEWI